MQARNTLRSLFMMAALFLPSMAFAQIFGGDISDDDVSVNQFLKPLFGRLVELGGGSGGGSDPFVELLATFNAGVLVLGGILVFYTLVAGTLSTAHDGEMLGKRWSSVWVPIRTALGAAAVMPSLGGYAVIQAVVMWLALQGVMAANKMWSVYLDSTLETTMFMPPGNDRQIREAFHDMFMSNVCTSGFRKGQGLLGSWGSAVNLNPIPSVVTPVDSALGVKGFQYGPLGSMCGRVLLPQKSSPAGASQVADGPASAAALVDAQGLNAALASVHWSNLNRAQTSLEQLANRLVEGQLDQATFDSTMDTLVSTYSSELRTAAIEQYNSQKETIHQNLVAGMKKDGWALAGMYYMAIIRAQDEITRAISQMPGTASGPMSGSGSFAIDFATSGLGGAVTHQLLNAFVGSGERKAWFQEAEGFVSGANSANQTSIEQMGNDATGRSWVMKLVSWFINDDQVFLGATSNFAQQNQNPIVMAKNLGENLTATAWAGFGAGVVLLGASGIGMGVAGDWAEVLSGPLFAVFAMLVVPGATLSTYVPMIPYILWVGVMIGWVLLVIEAIIGSPIWAVAHMAPDGDGVVGRGGQGYMLVLSLVLRPPLMILGLVCSITLMNPLGYFINSTFLGSFAIGVNPGPFALTQLIAGCIIYVVVMVSVIHRVFTLVHVIPDRILRWIGGGGNELGEQAQGMESFSAAKTVAASAAMNQIGEVSRSVGQGARQLGMKGADKRNAESIREEEARSRMAQEEANKHDESGADGMSAKGDSAAAAADPQNLDLRRQAEFSNQMARDSQLTEAEMKVGNFMEQRGQKGGLNGFRQMSMAEREKAAAEKAAIDKPLSEAMEFANKMDRARAEQAVNPTGNAMGRFLGGAVESARKKGHEAPGWEKAAARGMGYELERQKWSAPPPPPEE